MQLSFLLEQAYILKSEIDTLRPLDKETEARIFEKLRLDWNYHSNHLEGNQLTYGETKALIYFGMTAQGKPLKDHLETSGHNEAILWIEEIIKNEYPLTEAGIRELHKHILKEPYYKPAMTPSGQKTTRQINIGRYKETPNHVLTETGEIFRFATPEETPAKMQDLLSWYNQKKNDTSISPILFAAEFHYKFVAIHPFDDGNGRMSRLLMNFILMQFGYPPAIIRTEDKANYFAVLRQADAGKLEPFVGYIAENLIHSLELMLKGANGESIEEPDDLDKAIALLENKLKSATNKIEKLRSNDTIKEWKEQTFPTVVESFIKINDKFKKFYVEQDYFIHYYVRELDPELLDFHALDDYDIDPYYFDLKKRKVSNTNVLEEMLKCLALSEPILAHQEKAYSYLSIICKHHIFNRPDIGQFDYPIELKIVFENTKYCITGIQSQKSLSKLYHQIPTKEELDYIYDAEAKTHLEFIQKQIEKPKENSDTEA